MSKLPHFLKSAIILTSISLITIMTILLINSCGVQGPTSAPVTTGTGFNAATGINAPLMSPLPPVYLPWLTPDAAPILSNPYANPDANGPLVPFYLVCGEYAYIQSGAYTLQQLIPGKPPDFMPLVHHQSYSFFALSRNGVEKYREKYQYDDYFIDINGNFISGIRHTDPWAPGRWWTVPCNPANPGLPAVPGDLFDKGGSGFPPGDYIGPDGTIYHNGSGGPPTPPDPNQPRKLIAVHISPHTASMSVGGTASFTGTAYYNKPPVVVDATGSIVSQNPTVATIAGGIVTAKSRGSDILILTVENLTDMAYVDVNASGPPKLSKIKITAASTTLKPGETMQLNIEGINDDGSIDPTITNGNPLITYSSSDSTIAIVDANGVVTGLKPGTVTIEVLYDGIVYGSITITVNLNLMSLLISPTDISTKVGKTTQFQVTGLLSDGTFADPGFINPAAVQWSSSDPNIAIIYNGGTSGGQAWGKAKGTVDIQARYDTVPSNIAKLHVGNQLKSISVSPAKATIYVYPTKGVQQYTATATFSDETTQSPLSPVTWDTLPGGIANIDANGKAIAVTPGTTYISAASDSIISGVNDTELCVECWQYTHLRQNHQAWSPNPLAYHRYDDTTITIGRRGCAITSAAMALTATGTSVDPGTLEQWLFDNGGFTRDNCIKWGKVTQFPGGHLSNWHSISSADVATTLNKCKIVIVSVHNSILSQHWVILTKEQNGNYMMYDPWMYTKSDPTPNLTNLLTVYSIKDGYFTFDVQ